MLKKFLSFPGPVKLYLLWGIFYYMQYLLFQQFLPLHIYNRQFSKNRLRSDRFKPDLSNDCKMAFGLLYANLSALRDCRCRTYVAFRLYRNVFPKLIIIYASKLAGPKLTGHCWVSCPNGTNLSDLYEEHQGFTEIYRI